LLRIVEERWDDDLFGLGDSERLPHVRETFLDGEVAEVRIVVSYVSKYAGSQISETSIGVA